MQKITKERILSRSYTFRIPIEYMELLNLKKGQTVYLSIKNSSIELTQIKSVENSMSRSIKKGGAVRIGIELTQQLKLKIQHVVLITLDLEKEKIYIEQAENPQTEPKIIISKRDNYIVEQRDAGKAYTNIAKELGITDNRVRQIYVRIKRKLKN